MGKYKGLVCEQEYEQCFCYIYVRYIYVVGYSLEFRVVLDISMKHPENFEFKMWKPKFGQIFFFWKFPYAGIYWIFKITSCCQNKLNKKLNANSKFNCGVKIIFIKQPWLWINIKKIFSPKGKY